MKITAFSAGFLTCATLSQAMVNLTYTTISEEGRIRIGDKIQLEWTTDRTYDLELELVKKEEYGWRPVSWAFEDVRQEEGDGKYTFKIPRVERNKLYAFWLGGTEIQGNAGYANLTQWFMINGKARGLTDNLE